MLHFLYLDMHIVLEFRTMLLGCIDFFLRFFLCKNSIFFFMKTLKIICANKNNKKKILLFIIKLNS